MKHKKQYFLPLLILSVTVFFTGFLIGSGNQTNAQSTYSSITSLDNNKKADFTSFWQVWDILDDKYPFESPDQQEKVYGAIKGLASAYGDPYTVFLPPEETESMTADLAGEFGGVGMEVGFKDGAITVIAPLKDTPAYKAGILAGDIIYEIDGEITVNMSVNEAVQKIRGPVGTTVTISVLRVSEAEPVEINIIRDIISIPTLETELLADNKVFLISLYNFTGNVDELFRQAIFEFQNSPAEHLILDLRNNPGGFLQSAINLSSWFLPVGEKVVEEFYGEDDARNKSLLSLGFSSQISKKYNMVILLNQGSASASEILAGALKSKDHITTIGTQTFGKGSVQELVPVGKDTALKVTVAKWFTPTGISISENGLTPEIEVSLDINKLSEEGIDTQLETALSFLINS